jgi:hypothetical protein
MCILYQFIENTIAVFGADDLVQVPEALIHLQVATMSIYGMIEHGANLGLQMRRRPFRVWFRLIDCGTQYLSALRAFGRCLRFVNSELTVFTLRLDGIR